MDVERTVEFIVETLARVTSRLDVVGERLEALTERMDRAEGRASRTDARLDRAIRLAVQEARNERKKRQEMEARWAEKMTQLAAAQLITEEKTQQLDESVRKLMEKFDRFFDSREGGGNGSH